MKYTIVLERGDDGGWSGFAPDLPGLLLAGDTRDALIDNAPSAIADYIEAMQERGLSPGIPGEHVAEIFVSA